MPSYAIIGASRGLGYGFLEVLSADPSNTIIGTARTVASTAEKVKADGLKNVHIIQADMTDYASLKAAAAETAKITGGSLDYLVVNGAYLPPPSYTNSFLSDFDTDNDSLVKEIQHSVNTNVIGAIHAINAFLPLIQKSSIKKVLAISSGVADDAVTSRYGLWESAPYAISKSGLNTVIAKYDAKYRKEGILFLSISPGVVDTGHEFPTDSEMPMKFMQYAPHFKGMITTRESVDAMMLVAERATPDNGFGGAFVSHFGNKQWI